MQGRLCRLRRPTKPTALIWRCIDEDCAKQKTTAPDHRAALFCECGTPMRAVDYAFGDIEEGTTG